jgi:hypothetical protein
MRLIMVMALLMTPFAVTASAQAANLSNETLGGYRSSCVRSCAQKHDRGVCQRACRCMSDEMKQHWKQEHFNKYAATLKKDPKDRATNRMVRQMAAFCFQKARGG